MLLQDLEKRSLINPPTFLACNTHYLCRMGSVAYGVSTDNSDIDIYGVCVPPQAYIFPQNYIEGFDDRPLTFNQWQKHGIYDPSANGGKGAKYDFAIYNIVNFFSYAMENNPNVLDALFVRREHVIHSTPLWEIVRENRKLFLHKGVTQKMKGYAYSQLSKAKNCVASLQPIIDFEDYYEIPHGTTHEQAKNGHFAPLQGGKDGNSPNGPRGFEYDRYMTLWEEGLKKTTRFEQQKLHGMDCKFMYHVFRLVDQAEYILNHHDLDLQETSRVEKMKAIRRGDIPFEDLVKQFGEAEERLTRLYESSRLRMKPLTKEIRAILVAALESHYGSLREFLKESDATHLAVNEIKETLRRYGL